MILGIIGSFGPTASALIVTGWKQGKLGVKELLARGLRWRFPGHIYAATFLMLPILALIALLLTALIPGKSTSAMNLLFAGRTMVMNFPIFLVMGGSLAEELGWRGYALDRLLTRGWSPTSASFMLGIVHSLWHLPLFFMAGTTQQLLTYYSPLVALYFINIISQSFIYTWLYQISGRSGLAPILFHTMVNLTYLGLTLAQMDLSAGFNPAAIDITRINLDGFTAANVWFDGLVVAFVGCLIGWWRHLAKKVVT